MAQMTVSFCEVENENPHGGTLRRPLRYAAALASVVAAWLLRLVMDPYLRNLQPFPTFYLAVAFVAWRCGWRPALVVQILGYLAGDWFFSPPRASVRIEDLGQGLELVMYFAVTSAVDFLIQSLRKAQHRAEAALKLAHQKEKELEENIVVRKRLEEALTRSKEALEQMVQQRTAKLTETIGELEGFSYSITHDMRAPLRAMQSFTAMIEAECAGCGRNTSQDLFRRIKIASRRLEQLITDALDYSKLVREEVGLQPIDLAILLKEMIETYPNLQPPAAEVHIEFSELHVSGNEAALTQCFSNLLGNAVKFVAPGVQPRVRVWAEQRDDMETRRYGDAEKPLSASPRLPVSASRLRIWVEDNGIGIPREAHQKIFGMFQRMHRQDEYPGTGIGLTIVRKAAERMGGTVGVESEPGKGSRFWIELAEEDRS